MKDALDDGGQNHGGNYRRQLLLLMLLMTSSISDLVDHGSTNPATRLMAINTSPSNKSHRRGRTIFQISGHKTRSFTEAFFFSCPLFEVKSFARAPDRVASFDPLPDAL